MRTRQVLRETLNKIPKPESVIQNQYLLLEVLCDIRDAVLHNANSVGIPNPVIFKAPWEGDEKEIDQKDLDFIKKDNEPI